MPAHLSTEQFARDLSIRDLTDPAAGPHALQLLLERAVEALAYRWECEIRWWRGDRVVSIEDNYDNLGYRADDVTREARYTRYVDEKRMLRSHSSAMIPAALRALAADPADDVLLVCPGMVCFPGILVCCMRWRWCGEESVLSRGGGPSHTTGFTAQRTSSH